MNQEYRLPEPVERKKDQPVKGQDPRIVPVARQRCHNHGIDKCVKTLDNSQHDRRVIGMLMISRRDGFCVFGLVAVLAGTMLFDGHGAFDNGCLYLVMRFYVRGKRR